MLPPADVGPTAQSHEARGWWEAWDYNKSSPSTVFAALNFTDTGRDGGLWHSYVT